MEQKQTVKVHRETAVLSVLRTLTAANMVDGKQSIEFEAPVEIPQLMVIAQIRENRPPVTVTLSRALILISGSYITGNDVIEFDV